MKIIWDKVETTAPEVHEIILESKQVTYATVKTIINRLEAKHALVRTKSIGRTIYFKAEILRDDFKSPLLDKLISRVFGGEKRNLFSHLINDEKLSEQDIAYLESLLSDKKKQQL